MLDLLSNLYTQASEWLNENQGVVDAAVFLITIAIGWASGIFASLRRRPKFRLSLIEGPTFCCTFNVGKRHGDYETHRTGIALYLNVANVGSEASSIESVEVGYHWHLRPFSTNWLRYSIGWFWLKNQSVSLRDFQAAIGANVKIYPFLTQKSHLSSNKAVTYLEVGRSTNGVVYFEQTDSWGGCRPSVRGGKVRITVCVRDVFGKRHSKRFWVSSVTLAEARKYNPSFGQTHAEVNGEALPFDQP